VFQNTGKFWNSINYLFGKEKFTMDFKGKQTVLATMAVSAVLPLSCESAADAAPPPEIKLIAHRGIPWDWPENTLLSFRKALETRADILEFDVRLSKDKVPLIMHDDTLDRTTDRKGLIGEKTLAEIKEANVIFTKSGTFKSPEPVPTLDETIELLKEFPGVLINCEIKDYSGECIKKTVDAFRAASMLDRTYFACFDYSVLEKIKAVDGSLKVQGFPLGIMKNVPKKNDAEKLFDYVGIPIAEASRGEVKRFESLGIITGVWVVNDPGEIPRVRELGTGIVTTDRFTVLREYLDTEKSGESR
jgi:glycerophosphoryl diester phosphodiesterase